MSQIKYHPHEAARHTDTMKEIVQRACKIVFTAPNMGFCVQHRPWYLLGASQRVRITVFRRTGCCQRQPVCMIEIDRPLAEGGLHEYTAMRAVLHQADQHAANTRLLGHLRLHCPYLPEAKVTMGYELKPPAG